MPGLTQEDVTPVVPEQQRAGAQGTKPKQGYQWNRWLKNPGNEVRWLWNKAGETVKELNKNVDKQGRVGVLKIYTTKDNPTQIKTGATPAQREPIQGAVEAIADVPVELTNIGQNVIEAVRAPIEGREMRPQDADDTPVGRLANGVKELSADLLGVPQRWELDDEDQWARNVGSASTSALIAAFVLQRIGVAPGKNPLAFTGTKVNPFSAPGTAQVLSQVKGPWGAYWRANPKWAQTAARWLAYGGSESFLTTAISDQRDFGRGEPNDDRFRATVKSLFPNAGEDLILGGAATGLGFGAGKMLNQFFNGKSRIAQNNKAWRTVDDVEKARAWAQENGIQQRTGEGDYEFLAEDPWETGSVTTEEVSANIEQAAAVEPDAAKTPREAAERMVGGTSEPEISPWDPSLPEVDTLIRGIDELDDAALIELGREITEGANAVQALGEKLNRTGDVTPDVPVGPEAAPAPDAAIPDADMFASIDLPQLRAIAKIDARVQAELARMNAAPAKATRQELISAILTTRGKGAATATPAVVPETAMPAAQRNELKTTIVKKAVVDGQVRPSATEPPELPTRTTKDPAEMTPAELIAEESRLAGEYQALENAKAERVAREAREATGYYEMTPEQQAVNGKFDGWTKPEPEVATPNAVEFPAKAVRKITAKNQGRVQGKANQLKNWANHGLPPEQHLIRSDQQAESLVNAKGSLLNVEEIPGINLDKAMDDYAMGMKTPETDAVAQAYRQFYGLEDAPASTRLAGDDPLSPLASVDGDDFAWNNGPEMQEKLAKLAKLRASQMRTGLVSIGEQVFGKGNTPGYRFNDEPVTSVRTRDWGGDGSQQANTSGTYYPVEDVIAINALIYRPWDSVRQTMFHEAWHRIQYGYLNKKQLKVLDSVFGKSDLRNLSGIDPKSGIKPIEIQAVAFQAYANARQKGMTRMGLIREAVASSLEEAFPGVTKSLRGRLTTEALAIIGEGWERIMDFYNRSMNFINGNGFTNVYDIFEEAWSGRLAANKEFGGFYQVLHELGGFSEEAFAKRLDEDPAGMEKLFMGAIDREQYWNKWRELGNNVVEQIDGEIAALKQQALQGGC